MIGRAVGVGCVVLALWPRSADAVKFRRPFDAAIGVNYGYDNNGGGAGCTDYQCGSVCYDTHGGTDFPLAMGTAVRAAASGTVSATYNGCSDWGSYGNSCGGYCGNYVRITHVDGTQTLFCHMKLGSIAVGSGQAVSCGEYLGQSASSGSSTGPHLHFGLTVGGASRDPFAGSCSHAGSYWVSQGTYPHPVPSAQCETVCQCTVGAVESRGCCDCGSQSRTCGGDCTWGGWSECAGADPGGGDSFCDTGELGACAEGRRRCVGGCLSCARVHSPVDESCDDVDNDCDGAIDEGSPMTVGWPPPAWAARQVDASLPQLLPPGGRGEGWVVFENVGTEIWPSGEVWLALVDAEESRVHDPATWPAHDILALVAVEVGPGERAMLPFSFLAATEDPGPITERFQLHNPVGEPLRCPSAEIEVEVDSLGAVTASPPPEAGEGVWVGGCAVAGRGASWPLLLALLLLLGRVRRDRRLTQRTTARGTLATKLG